MIFIWLNTFDNTFTVHRRVGLKPSRDQWFVRRPPRPYKKAAIWYFTAFQQLNILPFQRQDVSLFLDGSISSLLLLHQSFYTYLPRNFGWCYHSGLQMSLLWPKVSPRNTRRTAKNWLYCSSYSGLSLRIFRHSYRGRVVQKSHSSTPKFTRPHLGIRSTWR